MSFAVHPEQRSPGEETMVRAGTASQAPASAAIAAAWSWWAPLERAIARRLLAWVGEVPISVVLPGGEEVRKGSQPPIARIRVADAGTLLGLIGPDASCTSATPTRMAGSTSRATCVSFSSRHAERPATGG